MCNGMKRHAKAADKLVETHTILNLNYVFNSSCVCTAYNTVFFIIQLFNQYLVPEVSPEVSSICSEEGSLSH